MSREINDLKQQIMWLQNQNAFLKNREEALRDHFAGLAMQSLYLSNTKWEATGEERDEESVALIKELACDAYYMADAMIERRMKNG
jgi:hypothetical protein